MRIVEEPGFANDLELELGAVEARDLLAQAGDELLGRVGAPHRPAGGCRDEEGCRKPVASRAKPLGDRQFAQEVPQP